MPLETTRFGPIEFDDSAVLTFTQPIIGFHQFRRFVLLPGGAPVLVNRTQRLAKQTILEMSEYPVRFELRQAQGGARSPQEVSHARTDS